MPPGLKRHPPEPDTKPPPDWWPKDTRWIARNDLPTPLGLLSGLRPEDPQTARHLLAHEKSQLADGLLSELLFDQMFEGIPERAGIVRPALETAIAWAPEPCGEWLAFVWPHAPVLPGTGRYLRALEAHFRVLLIGWDRAARQFSIQPVRDGQRCGTREALVPWLHEYCKWKPKPFRVEEPGRNVLRHEEVWTPLAAHYGADLCEQVTLPRVLMNYGIQPWFRALWNVDRVLMTDDVIWAAELKHKFPGPRSKGPGVPLFFGLNTGQQSVYERLTACGIRCLHLVMAKPFWTEEVGAAYLITEPGARDRVAVLGRELDAAHFDEMQRREVLISYSNTTITAHADSILGYNAILIPEFTHVGMLAADPRPLGARILSFAQGARTPPASELLLRELELAPPSPQLSLW
jgi:hypothetical protein